MKTAILAIIMFCIMIFPHELGHFIAAKKNNVQVNEFAFGMGPAIWKKQKGETLYAIRLFPIGGFCAMEGEDGSEEDEDEAVKAEREHNPRAFNNKKPWQKLIVLVAGSFMNVVCALLVMIITLGGIGFTTTTIASVVDNSPAFNGGLVPGDKIVQVNDQEVKYWSEIAGPIQNSNGETVHVTVNRKGVLVDIPIVPELTERTLEDGTVYSSYTVGMNCKVSHNPGKAIVSGTQSTWNMTKALFVSFAELFTGKVSPDEMAGPVGMVQMVNQTINVGLWYYGYLVSLICLNLAIVNMLPLPALDGGRIIFVLFTWITGKPVSEKVESAVHFAGMILLLSLMVFVTKNDILRLFR